MLYVTSCKSDHYLFCLSVRLLSWIKTIMFSSYNAARYARQREIKLHWRIGHHGFKLHQRIGHRGIKLHRMIGHCGIKLHRRIGHRGIKLHRRIGHRRIKLHRRIGHRADKMINQGVGMENTAGLSLVLKGH